MKQLAIVIPAFKIDYFRATLDSLAAQTCKDFTVYVGDDCSPSDFRSLVDEYVDKIDIRYTRFENNLGGKDLVAQWTRCVDLTNGEPWLWLFSDDDIIGANCVKDFYSTLMLDNSFDIYHFNVEIIDANGCVSDRARPFPDIINAEDFYCQKETDKLDSFVVEYIFSRNKYELVDGFQSFNMAWGSDVGTWVKIGREKGIKTIEGDKVFWRRSGINITTTHSREVDFKKLMTNVDFISWINSYFGNKKIRKIGRYILFRYYGYYSLKLSTKELLEVTNYAIKKGVIYKIHKYLFICLLPFIRLIKKFKTKIIK